MVWYRIDTRPTGLCLFKINPRAGPSDLSAIGLNAFGFMPQINIFIIWRFQNSHPIIPPRNWSGFCRLYSPRKFKKRTNLSFIFDASQDELYHFSMKRSNLQWSRPEFQSICSKGVLAVCCYMTRLSTTNDIYK